MMAFHPLIISAATLLLVSCSLADVKFMDNGKPYDDEFHELFTQRAPVNDIIKLAVSWNADKQLDHFDQLYHHIDAKDEWAEYAQNIVNATRAVLKRTLKNVGYEKDMTLEEYLISTFLVQNGRRHEVSADVLEGLDLLDKVDGDAFEQLLNQGGEQELQWELNHLYRYKEVPNDSAKKLKVELRPENKPVSEAEKSEGSDAESTAEPQESQEQNADSQDQVQPPQGLEEGVEKIEESTEESLEDSEEPEKELKKLVNAKGEPVRESEESIEESEEPVEESKAPIEDSEEPVEDSKAPVEESEEPTEEVIAEPENLESQSI